MDQQKIGQFILEQRKKHELTQRELADRLGVTNKAVSKWELGRSMPDVSLFEPLCQELEISIPELLAGQRIDVEDRQSATEQLLMESISTGKLIGLSVFLQINSVIGSLLVISPLLFHPEKPLDILLVVLGLLDCAMGVYFDTTLPGKEVRNQSLIVRFTYAVCLFAMMAAIGYPSAVRAGAPAAAVILVYSVAFALTLLVLFFIWRYRKWKTVLLITVLIVLGSLALLCIHANRFLYIVIENKSDDDIYGATISYCMNPGSGENEARSSMSAVKHTGSINDNTLLPFHTGARIAFVFPPRSLPDLLPESTQITVSVEMSRFSMQSDTYKTEQPVIVPLVTGKCCIVEITGNTADGFTANYCRTERGVLSVFIESGIWW